MVYAIEDDDIHELHSSQCEEGPDFGSEAEIKVVLKCHYSTQVEDMRQSFSLFRSVESPEGGVQLYNGTITKNNSKNFSFLFASFLAASHL